MILIDSNVFMYAAGAAHPNKAPSVKLLARVARGEVDATIDAETLQEILHRYQSLRRWADGRAVYALTRRIVANVIPITAEIADAAFKLIDADPTLMARDALHAAAARHIGASCLCSFDRDFDRIPGLVRREPSAI